MVNFVSKIDPVGEMARKVDHLGEMGRKVSKIDHLGEMGQVNLLHQLHMVN